MLLHGRSLSPLGCRGNLVDLPGEVVEHKLAQRPRPVFPAAAREGSGAVLLLLYYPQA